MKGSAVRIRASALPPAGGLGPSVHRALPRVGLNPPAEEGSVICDEAEQRRATGVLPREAEEVEAGRVADAAPLPEPPASPCGRRRDPGVIETEAGRPDHGVDLELGRIGEGDRPPGR